MSDFADRGTWQPLDVRIRFEGEVVSDQELESLSDAELVELIVERSSLDEEGARAALVIIRGGPPEGYTFER